MAEKRVKRTHMKPFLHTQHESGVRSTVRPTARAVERLDTGPRAARFLPNMTPDVLSMEVLRAPYVWVSRFFA